MTNAYDVSVITGYRQH